MAAAADSWAWTKDVKSAVNIARSISTMKSTTESMTAGRKIWQSNWHGEERVVYLDGRTDNAFWASLEQDYYYRRRAV